MMSINCCSNMILFFVLGILIVFNRPDGLVPITTDEKKTPR